MKKALISIIFAAMLLTGCNYQAIDINYTFNYAIIEGVGEVKVKSWVDYDDSDMVQVVTEDNVVYYTHGSNVILIKK